MYAIRKMSFSSFHEHSWGKVGGRRGSIVILTKKKREVVSEYMASTVGVIHSTIPELYDC